MTGIKSPAEMRKLAEAVLATGNAYRAVGTDDTYAAYKSALSELRAACSCDQIIHDANLIEAQARRIEELEKAVAHSERILAALDTDDYCRALSAVEQDDDALLSTPGAS